MRKTGCLILLVFFFLGCSKQQGEPQASVNNTTETDKTRTEQTTPVDKRIVTAAELPGLSESPALKKMVEAGELPPVEQRLPKQPKVLSPGLNELPSDQIDFTAGTYSPTLVIWDQLTVEGDAPNVSWAVAHEPLLSSPGMDTLGARREGLLRGNVLESYQVGDDFRNWTFKLREGLKWSDGEPVTTDDVQFAWDMLQDKKFNPRLPNWLRVNSDPAAEAGTVVVDGPYQFRIEFPQPYPLFDVYLGQMTDTYWNLFIPSHYYKERHREYADEDALLKMMTEFGYNSLDEWERYYNSIFPGWPGIIGGNFAGRPVLTPWVYSHKKAEGVYIYKRNPYYFKVDHRGQQLPYFDEVEAHYAADYNGVVNAIIQGNADFAAGYLAMNDFPAYRSNADLGNYQVKIFRESRTPYDVYLNLTYQQDPEWQQLVSQLAFRKALNMAIDRDFIIESVQHGFGSYVKNYPEEFFRYDPEEANRLLDELGLNQRDDQGYRTFPSGKKLVIPFEITDEWGTKNVIELVQKDWMAVGLNTTLRVQDWSYVGRKRNTNQLMVDARLLDWNVVWSYNPLWTDVRPSRVLHSWAPAWRNWYNTRLQENPVAEITIDGKKVKLDIIEPNEIGKKFISLLEQSVTVIDEQERAQVFRDAYQLVADNYLFFPLVESGTPVVYRSNMGNIPHNTQAFGLAISFAGEQLYLKS